jgi:hypothetical protein
LAESWHSDSTSRTWTFVLRDGAHFPDGSRLTARSVESDWHRRDAALRAAGLESVFAPDDRSLRLTMKDRGDSLPQLFADPLWSVLPESMPKAAPGTRMTIPLGQDQPILQILAAPQGDLRDALDAGADLVVSGDPQVIDYAARHGDFETFPLPWDRTYALLQHPGTLPLNVGIGDSTVLQSLARDAVQTDARPAQTRAWWGYGPCAIETLMEVTIPTATRILYPTPDPVARQLAERIVALAGDHPPLNAVGVNSVQFAEALKRGNDRGYIVALPFRSASPCRESAEWTGIGRLQPLIDTRQRAIVRRGSPPLSVDWDGTVRVQSQDDDSDGEVPR